MPIFTNAKENKANNDNCYNTIKKSGSVIDLTKLHPTSSLKMLL